MKDEKEERKPDMHLMDRVNLFLDKAEKAFRTLYGITGILIAIASAVFFALRDCSPAPLPSPRIPEIKKELTHQKKERSAITGRLDSLRRQHPPTETEMALKKALMDLELESVGVEDKIFRLEKELDSLTTK